MVNKYYKIHKDRLLPYFRMVSKVGLASSGKKLQLFKVKYCNSNDCQSKVYFIYVDLVSTDNNSSPKIKRKKISKIKKKDPNVSIFNVHKKSKTKNNDISSSENSLEDLSKWKMSSEKQRKYSQKSLKSHSSPIKTCNEENMKEFSSPMATPKFRVQSNKLGIGPSPYRSPQTRCSAPIVTLAGTIYCKT